MECKIVIAFWVKACATKKHGKWRRSGQSGGGLLQEQKAVGGLVGAGTQPLASNQHDWRTEQARAWHPAGTRWGSGQPGGTGQAQDHIGIGGDQSFWGPEFDGCIPKWS